MRCSPSIPSAWPRASWAWAMWSRWSKTVQRKVDVEQAEKLARKVTSGKAFNLIDLRDQLEQVRKLGGLECGHG